MGEARSPGMLPLNQFEELLIGVRAPLYSFARSLLGDDQAAYDIVQEAFVDAWHATQRIQSPFTTEDDQSSRHRWLFTVAYRKAISLRRHNRLISWRPLSGAPEIEHALLAQQQTGNSYSAFEDRIAEQQVLRAALGTLKPDEEAAILLSVVHGFSAPEIAQIVGINPDAVRKRLSRAMSHLRAAYFAQDDPTPAHDHSPSTPPGRPAESSRQPEERIRHER